MIVKQFIWKMSIQNLICIPKNRNSLSLNIILIGLCFLKCAICFQFSAMDVFQMANNMTHDYIWPPKVPFTQTELLSISKFSYV